MATPRHDRSASSPHWIRRILGVGCVLGAGLILLNCAQTRSKEVPPEAPASAVSAEAKAVKPSSPPVAVVAPGGTAGAVQAQAGTKTSPPSHPADAEAQAKRSAAMRGRAKADIVAIESALEHYAINNSRRYPDTLVPLVTPDVNGATYLNTRTMPKDPWENDYVYEPPSIGYPHPRILTLGRDGLLGGTGDDEDIDNLAIRESLPK